MPKENIRSIRMSDEIMEIVNQQQGRNFTEKFERLVYNCYMLTDQKSKEIKKLDEDIQIQREKLKYMAEQTTKLKNEQNAVSRALNNYHTALNIAVESIENTALNNAIEKLENL